MSEKRLLILTDRDGVGGAEVNLRDLLPALAARGWTARLLTTPGGRMAAYFARAGVPVAVAEDLRRTYSFSAQGRVSGRNVARSMGAIWANRRAVGRHLADFAPTAIVSVGMVAHALLAVLPPTPARRIMHLQDIVTRGNAFGAYGLGLDALAARADTVLTISEAVTETLAPRHQTKVVCLYNPLPAGLPTPPPADRVRRVGLFARYTPWKGHRDFLRIAAACATAEDPLSFVAFGAVAADEQPYLDALRAEARTLPNADHVALHGFTDDVYTEMAACDVVLHLSTAPEPFGRILLEANACGVPVLAYRGGGVDELFDTLGLAGRRFPTGDWQAVATALRTFIPAAHPLPDLAALHPDRYAARFEAVLTGEHV